MVPDGNWALLRTGNPGIPPMKLLPLPLFCPMFDENPLRPVRKGMLLLFTIPPLALLVGRPLFTGRTAPLGLAKGTCPPTAGLATMPVTAMAEGWVPPRMSCMKKVREWSSGITVGAAPPELAELTPGAVVAAPPGVMPAVPPGVVVPARTVAGPAVVGSSSSSRAEVADEIMRARMRRETMFLN